MCYHRTSPRLHEATHHPGLHMHSPRENRQAAEPPTHSHKEKKNNKIKHKRNPETGQRAFPNPAGSGCSNPRSSALQRGSCILQPSKTEYDTPEMQAGDFSPPSAFFFLPVWGCSCRALTALWLPWAACTAPDRGVTAPRPRWLVLNTRIRLESRHRALFFLSGGAGEEGGSPPPWGRWVSVRPEPAAAPSLSPTSGCRPRLPPVKISDLPGVMLPLYWFTSLNSATISSYPYQA